MRTTAFIGCARIISSVSVNIKLRRNMLVGEKLWCTEVCLDIFINRLP